MEETNRRYHVLLFVPKAEDLSVVQNALGAIGAEGFVCRAPAELGRCLGEAVDAVLWTEEGWAEGAFSVFLEALQHQPQWSELPVVIVAAGGAESRLAAQAVQQLRNALILDRPLRDAVLSSALRMALRTRDKQRQVCHLLAEREQCEQALRNSEHRFRRPFAADQLREEATRRVRAEDQLRRHAQMLEAFFEHTIAPLVFLDRHFNFVRVNEAFARVAGKEPEYFAGKNYFALYPHEEHRAIFEQVVQAKQPYRAYAKVLAFSEAPQHGVTYWNWWLTPLLDEAGEIQSLVLNLEDVTERQKAFSELEERARQLQQLTLELSQAEDRERQRLAEVLHDDLQQLLAAAKFHLGLLSKDISGDQERRELAEVVKDLLRQAIDKSRSLSHELSPPGLAHTDLRETLEWLAEQVRVKHGLAVHLDIRDRAELHSEPLKAFLFKAAQEMLFNVIKHAQVKKARLRLRRRRGCIYLAVSDRGRGFDPQATGTTGFGLRSLRERVQMLGGRIRIRSAPGRGSALLLAVPDSEPPTGEPQKTPVEQPALGSLARKKRVKHPGEHVLRVLLVDDHKIVREGIEAMLVDELDIEIVGQAGNGREAVDLACQLRPDVVVMDVAMPVMGGDEATRQIKRHLPETRVIALSMFDDARVAERMRRAGATAYLLKTAPSEDLLAALRGGRKTAAPVS
jgi:PAS domain S-box-containing protein